jgi:hypothetical protein
MNVKRNRLSVLIDLNPFAYFFGLLFLSTTLYSVFTLGPDTKAGRAQGGEPQIGAGYRSKNAPQGIPVVKCVMPSDVATGRSGQGG